MVAAGLRPAATCLLYRLLDLWLLFLFFLGFVCLDDGILNLAGNL